MDTEWMRLGSCRQHPPATFFPSDGVGVDRARKICAECPVNNLCLEYALGERIEHGVWGGASERQRRRILKSRAESGRAAGSANSVGAAETADGQPSAPSAATGAD